MGAGHVESNHEAYCYTNVNQEEYNILPLCFMVDLPNFESFGD